MDFCLNIAGMDCVVDYSYVITVKPYRGRPPSSSQPGEPPEPAEYEITVNGIREDKPVWTWLEMPSWLSRALAAAIIDDAGVYDAIMSDNDL